MDFPSQWAAVPTIANKATANEMNAAREAAMWRAQRQLLQQPADEETAYELALARESREAKKLTQTVVGHERTEKTAKTKAPKSAFGKSLLQALRRPTAPRGTGAQSDLGGRQQASAEGGARPPLQTLPKT